MSLQWKMAWQPANTYVATVADAFYMITPVGGEQQLSIWRHGQAEEKLGTHLTKVDAMKRANEHYGG